MAAITIQKVTKQFGTQMVLEEASAEFGPTEIVGFIGPNGSGKTTLFKLITGELAPDLGTVTRARGLEVGYLHQEPDIAMDRTLHCEVGSTFGSLLAMESRLERLGEKIAAAHDSPELPEILAEYDRVHDQFVSLGGNTFETRMNEIVGGLGFTESDQKLPMAVLSGGQRCRAALAKLLLEDRPMLLLDEPTNHLDIDAVRWLEKFLKGHRGGAVIISHDRYLLDRLCDRIVEVARRKLFSYPGNYSNFAQTKAVRELTQERQFEKDAAFIAKERDFIARHLAGQRSQQAKGRRTRLERQLAAGELVTELPQKRAPAKIRFAEAKDIEGVVLRVDELAVSFPGKRLFEGLWFQLSAGQRLGITGPNGVGKSTLLKVLVGECTAQSGTFEFGRKLSIGYYAQDRTGLDPKRTILEEVRAARPELSELQARSYAARFQFQGNDVFKPIGALSGGEQSRVRLATLILSQPDILILDEPTNHLDIPSREALEEALEEYAGTVIAVSHDRYFLDRAVERLLVIRREGCRMYEGNYSYYVEEVEQAQAVEKTPTTKKQNSTKKKVLPAPRKSSPYDHLSVEQLEEMLIDRETKLSGLHERFGDPAVCRDPDLLAELQDEANILAEEIAAVDAAWQERADANG